MATSPDGNGVILVGGYKYSSGSWTASDSILELKADGQGWVGAWTTLSTKLQYARYQHVIIPVLMNKNICGLDGIVSPTADRQIQQQELQTGCLYSTLGDGNCDDANNNAGCNYDLGDCDEDVRKCSKCKCVDQVCSICKCLDPCYE